MADKNTVPVARLVSEFMVTKVITIKPEMTLGDVAELLIRHQISGAPVVDQVNRVMSIMGEGVTLRLAASEGLSATIAHCLPKLPNFNQIITLRKDSTFTEAYRLFLKHTIHRIPIVDGNAKLEGLISRSSILQMFVEAQHGRAITRKT